MGSDAMVAMIIILGGVWGGVLALLIRAARSERRAREADRPGGLISG